MAGLSTSLKLKSTNENLRVVMIEARKRIGGRIKTIKKQGRIIEKGAQWIGKDQNLILALIEQLGLTLIRQNSDGEHFIESHNKIESEKEDHKGYQQLKDETLSILSRMKREDLIEGKWSEEEIHYGNISFDEWVKYMVEKKGVEKEGAYNYQREFEVKKTDKKIEKKKKL